MLTNDIHIEGSSRLVHVNRAKDLMGKLCNQNCMFCIEGQRRVNKDSQYLPTYDEMVASIDSIKENGAFKFVTLAGGEPTLSPLLGKLIEYISSVRLYPAITTNGSRLGDREYIESLKANGLHQINFSVHGIGETHDRITRTPNSFMRAMNGIKNALELDIVSTVNFVFTAYNLGDAVRLIELIENEYGHIKSYRFFNMVLKKGDANSRDIVPSYLNVKATCREIAEYCHQKKINVGFKNIPYCFYIPPQSEFFESGDIISPKQKRADYYYKSEKCTPCECNPYCSGLFRRSISPLLMDELLEPIV